MSNPSLKGINLQTDRSPVLKDINLQTDRVPVLKAINLQTDLLVLQGSVIFRSTTAIKSTSVF